MLHNNYCNRKNKNTFKRLHLLNYPQIYFDITYVSVLKNKQDITLQHTVVLSCFDDG